MADPITKITTSFKASKIIPDVIPPSYTFTPSVLFSIVYPAAGVEVILGDKVPRESTLDEPQIKIQPLLAPAGETWADSADSASGGGEAGDVRYTLVLTDPDAPSREDPKYGQWRHWVLTGIQLPAANAAETDGIYALKPKAASTPYIPPTPPPGSGFHRYIFLLFQEPTGGVSLPADAVEKNGEFEARRNWDAIAFAEKFGLKLVGANYFLTEVEKKE